MIEFTMMYRPNSRRFGWVVRSALLACLWACTLAALLSPAAALAQDEVVERDGRLEGYQTKVLVDNDSTALTWLLLVFLAMVTLGVMFKNARRTHLD
jgi:hypothetical protein